MNGLSMGIDMCDSSFFCQNETQFYCSCSVILVTIDQYNRFHCIISFLSLGLIVILTTRRKLTMTEDGGNENWLDIDDLSFKFDTPAPLSARK